jgi:hypothetical protein
MDKQSNMVKISILIRQKGRAEMFKNMCLSALEMATHPENIEFVSYVGDDDNEVYEYVGNHKVIRGDPAYNNNGYNACQKAASGDIYLFIANDFIFQTKDWDTLVLKEFDKYPDKIVYITPEDEDKSTQRLGYGIIGFLHKNWVDAVGYYMPPYEGARSHDKWLAEVAKSIGRYVHLPTMQVKHLNEKDEMHRQKNKRGLKEGWTKMYSSPEMVEARQREIKALQEYINVRS